MVRERIAQVQSRITGRLGTDNSAIHNRLIRFQTLLEKGNEGRCGYRVIRSYEECMKEDGLL